MQMGTWFISANAAFSPCNRPHQRGGPWPRGTKPVVAAPAAATSSRPRCAAFDIHRPIRARPLRRPMEPILQDQLQKRLKAWLAQTPAVLTYRWIKEASIGLGTTRGLRRSENQDRVAILRYRPGNLQRPPFSVAVLCDGMGGMVHGAESADISVSAFLTALARSRTVGLPERLLLAS